MVRGIRTAAAIATIAATGAFASPAAARESLFSFFRAPQGSAVSAIDLGRWDRLQLDVLRAGTRIGSDTMSESDAGLVVDLTDLRAGDEVRLFADGRLRATVVYDGLPAIGADACAGAQIFTVTRSTGATVTEAGFARGEAASARTFDGRWTDLNPLSVTLAEALAADDVAYVSTLETRGDAMISSFTGAQVGACVQQSVAPPPPPPAPPTAPPAPVDEASDAIARFATRHGASTAARSLAKRHLRPLVRRRSASLPFALTEPGTVTLTLTSAGGTVLGTGAKTLKKAGATRVTVKLNAAGRRTLRRAKSSTLKLDATFTPSRAGARAQTARRSVTLKR